MTQKPMRWIRGNIRRGSWLALLALAINLALSFGHVHTIDGKHTDSGLISLIVAASHTDRTQGHPDESQPDYLCPICTAVSAVANAFISAPPSLVPLDFASVNLDGPSEVSWAFAGPPTAAFQSRGPPIS